MSLFGDDSHKRADPDVLALMRSNGAAPPDAYQAVRRKADALLARLAEFETGTASPLERIKALASIAGFQVRTAGGTLSAKGRAAMFIPAKSGSTGGSIVYDSSLPMGRVIYSIGHEIAHSFFPTSAAGVQFRSMHTTSSKPGRQLELLCEYGAALLVMPELEFAQAIAKHGFGLAHIDAVRGLFGTSFEATMYREAETAPFPVAAVKFQYRLSKRDLETRPGSGHLFPLPDPEAVQPKYRCQTSRRSSTFLGMVPFNKSVREDSCVYLAGASSAIQRATEDVVFAGKISVRCSVEAVRAPFQRDGADTRHPDVLALFCPVIG